MSAQSSSNDYTHVQGILLLPGTDIDRLVALVQNPRSVVGMRSVGMDGSTRSSPAPVFKWISA
jgi:hypothetical protein